MAKYKTPVRFKGEKENKVFMINEEFEMNVKRAEEIEKNFKDRYKKEVKLERLDETETKQDDDKKGK